MKGDVKMTVEFFTHIIPPTKTHQEKKVHIVNGKPVFYEPAELREVRLKLRAYLSLNKPEEKLSGALRLIVKWLFPIKGKHTNGEYKITRPDTDNLIKLLKDVMTEVGFWNDDAQVASEINEKFYADIPGIYIRIEEIGQ